ncbi:hypothetical protein JXA80_05940, partial [bacterium]|nr:hypothetical protein [candidate division CSSED10-310 bacterium]
MKVDIETFIYVTSPIVHYLILRENPEWLNPQNMDRLADRIASARADDDPTRVQAIGEKQCLLKTCAETGIPRAVLGISSDFFTESSLGPIATVTQYGETIIAAAMADPPLPAADLARRLAPFTTDTGAPPSLVTAEAHLRLCALALNHPGEALAASVPTDPAYHLTCAQTGFTRDTAPFMWAKGQQYQAAISRMNRLNPYRYDAAIQHLCAALAVYDTTPAPVAQAVCRLNLGIYLFENPRGDRAANRETAVLQGERALEGFPADTLPVYRALTHMNLGTIIRNRTSGSRSENLAAAIDHYLHALTVFTRSFHPVNWAMIH